MDAKKALAVIDSTIRMGEVRADHNDKEGREALAALRAAVDERDALRAEVDTADQRIRALKMEVGDLKAELAAARPLIEAVIDLNETDILFKGYPSLRLKQAALGYREGRVVDEMKAEPGKVQVKYISTCPRCGLPTEHDDIIKPGDKFWSPETGPCEAIPAGEEGRKK